MLSEIQKDSSMDGTAPVISSPLTRISKVFSVILTLHLLLAFFALGTILVFVPVTFVGMPVWFLPDTGGTEGEYVALIRFAERAYHLQDPSFAVALFFLLLPGLVLVAYLCVAIFIIFNMRSLFRIYSAGQALTDMCARNITRIGIGVMIVPVIHIISGFAKPDSAAFSLVDQAENQASDSQASTGVSTYYFELFEEGGAIYVGLDYLAYWTVGGLFIMIGATMYEAVRIAKENREFI